MQDKSTLMRPHLRRWVVRALVVLVGTILTALFTVAAETAVCLSVVRDMRACVASAPELQPVAPDPAATRGDVGHGSRR